MPCHEVRWFMMEVVAKFEMHGNKVSESSWLNGKKLR